jgi:hypothetical protein
MDGDDKVGRLLAAHRSASSFLPDASAARHKEALPANHFRAVSGTWRFAAAEFVPRRGRFWLFLPTAVCADEKTSWDGAEPCAAPESCGSRHFADIR